MSHKPDSRRRSVSTPAERSHPRVGTSTAVRLRYAVFGADGECLAETAAGPASTFMIGHDELPAGLERAIIGLVAGSKKSILLEPEDAFGAWEPAQVITVDRAELPANVGVGDRFEAEHASGASIWLKVVELRENEARLDANHPLAGRKVRIEVSVEAVRRATAKELNRARSRNSADWEPHAGSLVPPERLLGRGQER